MDNTVSVISSVVALTVLGVLAFQSIQNNIEAFTTEEANIHNQQMAAAASSDNGSVNQTMENNAGMPTGTNLNIIQNKDFMLASSVDQGSMGSLPVGISQCALNQPAPTLASSLLPLPTPNESTQTWADPSCVSNALANQSMLSALDIIGVNTTASSFKNPSIDLRGDPVCNPRDPVTVFNNSSITCTLQRPLTCYDELPRPTIWSCDFNKDWWNNIDNVKPMQATDLSVAR